MRRIDDVLVGVHVHAQPARLHATLASLKRPDAPPFDLLLLPDGPDAETRSALAELDLPQDATSEPQGTPACFNRLARRHTGRVMVLIESGCVVGPGWLGALLAALDADPQRGMAGPSTNLAWNAQAAFAGRGGTPDQVAATAAAARKRYGSQVRTLAPLHGVADFCIAVDRSVLDAVGAADEGFELGPCWEMEYAARALRAGYPAVWACSAYVYRSPFTPRRAREERARLAAGKRRYQDAVCGLRLTGERRGYVAHCHGDSCRHFAPAALMRVQRPLAVRAERSPRVPRAAAAEPLVSCIMPTRNRADFALQAIALLERQDHEHWELVIVDDGGDGLLERLPPDARLRYVRAPDGESIGAKRNRALEAARGELVVHWDDDDWYAPGRLRRQIEPLLAGYADITALRAGTFLDLDRWSFWRTTPELHRRLFVEDVHGGTLAYRRTVWQRGRFPAVSLAEDAAFLREGLRRGARLARLENDGLFVYVRHAASAWRFRCGSYLDERGWLPADEPPLPAADREFLADRSAGAPARRAALVSCVMPTADRRPMVELAISYFLRQDYPARELIVLDDGDDRVADLIPLDPRIRYVAPDRRLVLGAKRNAACELARGEVIVHWDDDDWMAPNRLRYQVSELERSAADVCGSSQLLYLDPSKRAAWRYEYPSRQRPRWIAGNTLCYTIDAWRRRPFAELSVGEDTQFVAGGSRRLHALADPRFLVGILHGKNASPKCTAGAWWRRVPLAQIESVLADDTAIYLRV